MKRRYDRRKVMLSCSFNNNNNTNKLHGSRGKYVRRRSGRNEEEDTRGK